jgi:hypothetical protein
MPASLEAEQEKEQTQHSSRSPGVGRSPSR